MATTPEGDARVTFAPASDFGVLDHAVTFRDGRETLILLRLLPNGDVTEVELVLLRQPGMSDAEFARDVASVDADLLALKTLLEHRHQN